MDTCHGMLWEEVAAVEKSIIRWENIMGYVSLW